MAERKNADGSKRVAIPFDCRLCMSELSTERGRGRRNFSRYFRGMKAPPVLIEETLRYLPSQKIEKRSLKAAVILAFVSVFVQGGFPSMLERLG